MGTTYLFTDEEKKLRKRWLVATFLANFHVFLLIPLFILALISSKSFSTSIALSSFMFFQLLGLWIVYQLAYKKNGTKYLTPIGYLFRL